MNLKRIAYLLTMIIILSLTCSIVSADGFGFTLEEERSGSLHMIDIESGDVVYSTNAEEVRPMASLTKIMTYIVAYENIPNIETVEIEVTQEMINILASTGSSTAGIRAGEAYTGLQLLHLMMIPSGNDAALILAMHYDSIKNVTHEFTGYADDGADLRAYKLENSPFIALMNDKAEELGCLNTNFTNPHGLHHEEHYSTASEMAVITRYATTLPFFTEITSKRVYDYSPVNSETEKVVYNTNMMFSEYEHEGKYYYPYTTGIKTGSLTESGFCIASSAKYGNYAYIVIALGSPYLVPSTTVEGEYEYAKENGAMLDSKDLFTWAFANLEEQVVIEQGEILADIALEYAWDKNNLHLVAEGHIKKILPEEYDQNELKIDIDIPETVQAPVLKDSVIGVATIFYMGEEIGTVNLVSSETVQRSELVRTFEYSKDIITSPIFIAVIALASAILVVYILLVIYSNKKKKSLRQVNKYKK